MIAYNRGQGGYLYIKIAEEGILVCADFEDMEVCILDEPPDRGALAIAIQEYWPWATADKLVWPEDLSIEEVKCSTY